MTIARKLSLGFGTVVVLTAIVGGIALFRLSALTATLNQIAADALPGVYSVGKIVSIGKEQNSLMLSYIAADSGAQMDQFEQMIADQNTKFADELKSYQNTIFTSRDSELFQKIMPAHENLMHVWSRIEPLSRGHKRKAAMAMWINDAVPAAGESMRVIDDLTEFNKANGDALAELSNRASSSGRLWIIAVLLLALASGSGIAFYLTRGTNAVLRSALVELRSGAEQVAVASGHIASGSQGLAQGASEQAASLEETSASTQELAAMTQKNAASSQQAAVLMSAVDQRVTEANTSLEEMVASMSEINTSSNRISKIIRVIDEIAFQTNILALNAAVEAARAGEAGMGFAVVANEVRNLAQRSAQAAKDTAVLIEESLGRSIDGKTKLAKVGESIRSITESAQKVKTLVDEVSVSSGEQARGSEQISRAVVQMEKVTQQTAANAEESAAASEELNAQSETMKRVVAELAAMVDGARSTTEAEEARTQSAPKAPRRTQAATPASRRAMSKLVAQKAVPAPDQQRAPVALATAKINRDEFPLDDKFTEF